MSKRIRRQADRRSKSDAAPVESLPQRRANKQRVFEFVLLATIVLAGTALRLAFPQLTTVEHFDEGIYASNIWFDERTNFQYPMRHLYAPSLLPALIEGCMLLSGQISGIVAIIPSWFAGCASIFMVWWLARRWFDSSAAIAAACLAAFSDVHAMFTRTALTDVLLLFFFLAATTLFTRAFRTQQMLDYIAAGIAVGLAWWTKYNGWLPLLVVLVAIVTSGIADRSHRAQMGRRLAGWLAASVTALIVWSPYLYALQSVGGYSVVAANHSRYVVGLSGWTTSFAHQIANLNSIDSAWGSFGWGAALIGPWFVRRYGSHSDQVRRTVGWAYLAAGVMGSVFIAAVAASLGSGTLLLVFGTISIAVFLYRQIAVAFGNPGMPSQAAAPREQPGGLRITTPHESIGAWLVTSWFGLLFAMTPLYTPYLRLTLPWICAAWMASAWGVKNVLQRVEAYFQPRPSKQSFVRELAPVVVMGVAAMMLGLRFDVHTDVRIPWLDNRRGLERIASNVNDIVGRANANAVGATDLRVLYVFGEPALLFHLRVAGQPLVFPIDTVQLRPVIQAGQEVPTYLVVGLHASRDSSFQQDFEQARNRFELVQTFTYEPSTIVLLDQYDPRVITDNERRAEVRVYRVVSGE